ncbi:MAG: tRNA (adenosine(37)-N6)-threonylcarbamoyltransferase complex ATPase subunit type 1 TsaE [Planctomycetota bacterium]
MQVKDTDAIETRSAAETEALAERLARVLPGGMLIALQGELGAGKTVFVRGVARGLGVPADVMVNSPTYVLQHIYRGGRLTLYHLDLYRLLCGAEEFEDSGLRECLDDCTGLVCVEWPERLADFQWPADRIVVQLEHLNPQRRRIVIRGTGPASQRALGVSGIQQR